MSTQNEQDSSHRNVRHVTDADAAVIAHCIVDSLFDRLSDEETVSRLSAVWSKQFERHVGRVVLRGFYVILGGLVLLVGLRFDAIIAWLRHPT